MSIRPRRVLTGLLLASFLTTPLAWAGWFGVDKQDEGVCFNDNTNKTRRLNAFIIKKGEVIPAPEKLDLYRSCGNKINKNRIVEDEFILNWDLSSGFYLQGSACEAQPTLIVEVFKNAYQPITELHIRYLSNNSRHYEYNRPSHFPHDVYVLFRKDLTEAYSNTMEVRIADFLAIAQKQCGKRPKTIRLIARTFESSEGDRYGRAANYQYGNVYGGTLHLDEKRSYVDHDNKELANLYEEYYRKRNIAEQISQQRNIQQEAGAAAMLMMMLYGWSSSSPCNDPDASYSDRRFHECDH